mgnify:CR=1 FL=1
MAPETLRNALRRCHIARIVVQASLAVAAISGGAQWYFTGSCPWWHVAALGSGLTILAWNTWLRRRIFQTIHRGP